MSHTALFYNWCIFFNINSKTLQTTISISKSNNSIYSYTTVIHITTVLYVATIQHLYHVLLFIHFSAGRKHDTYSFAFLYQTSFNTSEQLLHIVHCEETSSSLNNACFNTSKKLLHIVHFEKTSFSFNNAWEHPIITTYIVSARCSYGYKTYRMCTPQQHNI